MDHPIKTERKRRGLTQAGLAEMAGINQSALSKIENRHVEPRLSTLQRIARVLDVDLGGLIGTSVASGSAGGKPGGSTE